jgi:hypothetical protein
MQQDRIADPPRLAGRVRGLGVCDVFRVELAPSQFAALDCELADRADAVARELRAAPKDQLELQAEEDTLVQVRERLPEHPNGPFVLTAPAGLVVELVSACLARAATQLAVDLGDRSTQLAVPTSQLEATSEWISTALDCHAVETFSFQPGVDPVRAW